jgi:hypothetical protein
MLIHCVCCVLRRLGYLLRADHFYRGALSGVHMCLIVCDLETLRIRCSLGLNWAVGRRKNKVNTRECVLIRNKSSRTHFRTVCYILVCHVHTHTHTHKTFENTLVTRKSGDKIQFVTL